MTWPRTQPPCAAVAGLSSLDLVQVPFINEIRFLAVHVRCTSPSFKSARANPQGTLYVELSVFQVFILLSSSLSRGSAGFRGQVAHCRPQHFAFCSIAKFTVLAAITRTEQLDEELRGAAASTYSTTHSHCDSHGAGAGAAMAVQPASQREILSRTRNAHQTRTCCAGKVTMATAYRSKEDER